MKRAVSLIIAVLVMVVLAVSVHAEPAVTEPQYIYFQAPNEGNVVWKNYKMVFCHMWSKTDGDIYSWQDKKEICEEVGGGIWKYDISKIEFDADKEYSLIFSNDSGMQTYNLNITSSCLGDIVYCKGDICANPVDGEKSCAVARWTHNGAKVHPAVEIDSAGKTLNPDDVDLSEAETKWGTEQGKSYELPESTSIKATEEKIQESETVDVDKVADKEDGINLSAATAWIVGISAVLILAVLIFAIVIGKRNIKNK